MKVVIIGAGQAGAWVARTLRDCDAAANIVLVGAERYPPYERPPLSKGVLSGKEQNPPCLLSHEQARESRIELLLDTTVTAIDRASCEVILADNRRLPYDKLVLATGGRARRLNIPGANQDGVFTLRSIDDAVRIRTALSPGQRIAVIGGGWIGLEVAATARRLGLEVIVIENGPRLCARSVPWVISDFLLTLHQAEGVRIEFGSTATAIESRNASGTLRLQTHRGMEYADVVLIGAGLEPNTELATACGLEVDNGIVTDISGRTSDPRIYAVGDVANRSCNRIDTPTGRVRLESWANAQNQGIAVGKAVAGLEAPQPELPWFWSDQYDVNLQVLGIPQGTGSLVIRGSPSERRFCLFELGADSRLQAVVAINQARELKLAKRLAKTGRQLQVAQLANPEIRLDQL